MTRLPLFIEVVANAQHTNVLVCRKIMSELFKQKIAPLPFAASIKEVKDVLATMKARGTRPSIFIVNTFEAEGVLGELDTLLGDTPTLFLLRQIFSETSVMMNAALGSTPPDSIGTILQRMTSRPNSVWTYGSKTSEQLAQKAARSLVEFFNDGDFFHVERHSRLQTQLMQMLKNASDVMSPTSSSSILSNVTVPKSQSPATGAAALRAPAAGTGLPAMKAPVTVTAATLKSPSAAPTASVKLDDSRRASARLAAPSNGAAIRGLLEQLGVSSILMMFEMEKKTGELVLNRRGETAKLFIKAGRIVRASVDGLSVPLESQFGPESVYYALTWTDGSFEFMPHNVEIEDEIKLPTTHFLMEAARRSDQPAG